MTAWNDDRTDRLKTLWAEGRTADWISKELGSGISRSAVLGKIHRLGLSTGRPPKIKPRPAQPPAASPRKRAAPAADRAPRVSAPAIAEPDPPPAGGGATIVSVRRLDCRWPYGDPAEPGFCLCGRPVARGAFCAGHAARAYRAKSQTPDSLMKLVGLF